MKKTGLKMWVVSSAITAVVIAAVIFLNATVSIIGGKLPLKIDLTRDKIFEFSEQTKDVMKNLDNEIKAYALLPDEAQGEYVDYMKEYLDKYKKLNSKFVVEYVDPYTDPTFMYKYADEGSQAEMGAVIIECGEKYKTVDFDKIFTYGYTNKIQIDMEREVTSAIMSVTGQLKNFEVLFTAGHGEEGAVKLKSLLESEGYSSKDIVLATEKIPEDAKIIFTVVPKEDFTAQERDALDAFMDKGGKYVFVASPEMPSLERIDSYLAEWGLNRNRDIVYETDTNSALTNGYGIPIPIAKIQWHTITEKIAYSQSPLAMEEATSITVSESANKALVTKLLLSTEKAYGVSIEKRGEMALGPLCMAAISENEDNSSAVLFIGSYLATENTEGAYLNSDFVLNGVNYLSGIDTAVSIRAKQISPEKMTMTAQQVTLATLLLQWVLPAIIVLIGLVVWLRRRYK